jgi:hypothetical protein
MICLDPNLMPWPRQSIFPKRTDPRWVIPIRSADRTIAAFIGALSLCSLLGCQLGPGAIQHGRIDYNEVIQRTNQEQTFVNILRVRDHKTTAFMDVTEVDAAVLGSAAFTGGIGGLGAGIHNASGETGSVSGTLQYQESPTIRYQPLLGQALISQVSTPLSVEALSDMISSGWPAQTVLDFALDRLTPDPYDRHSALNAIQRLFYYDALVVGTGKTQKPDGKVNTNTEAGIGNISVQVNNNTNSGSNGGSAGTGSQVDSLVLFLNPVALAKSGHTEDWNRLQRIFKKGQDDVTQPNQIVLRTLSRQPIDLKPGQSSPGPVIQTRSALGILKTATQYYGNIIVVSPDQYKKYKEQADEYRLSHNRKSPACYNSDSKTNWHYLLIIESQTLPLRRYVSHIDASKGVYYYIDADDQITQDNFALLSLFLTIQAVPTSPPLTPTISVGPRAGS